MIVDLFKSIFEVFKVPSSKKKRAISGIGVVHARLVLQGDTEGEFRMIVLIPYLV